MPPPRESATGPDAANDPTPAPEPRRKRDPRDLALLFGVAVALFLIEMGPRLVGQAWANTPLGDTAMTVLFAIVVVGGYLLSQSLKPRLRK